MLIVQNSLTKFAFYFVTFLIMPSFYKKKSITEMNSSNFQTK